MMGDPSHVPGQPQDIGTSEKNGVFPRVNTAACAPSAAITASFCNDNDEFCDSGTSLQVHESYVQVFGTQAAQFIVGKVGNSTVKAR
jgi:acetylxylan esterase